MNWQPLFDKRFRLFQIKYSLFDAILVLGLAYYIFVVRPSSIYQLVVLGLSVVVHEVAHGAAANALGDPTAKQLGRLSMNPLVHVDPLGTVILPGLLILSGSGFLIGWAKPVPVDTRHFKQPLRDMMLVALAGPVSNVILAAIAAVIFRTFLSFNPALTDFSAMMVDVLQYTVMINLVLAVFNMLPIPPLDGSRMMAFLLPDGPRYTYMSLEPYGFFIIMILAFFNGFSVILYATVPPLIRLFLGG